LKGLLFFLLLGSICLVPGSQAVVPAELAWLTAFASRTELNPQGCWQLTLAEGIVVVYIPAGEFFMGSKSYEAEVEAGEMPVHRVRVKGMLMGRTEVTRGLWQAVMGGNPLTRDDEKLPVTGVTYPDIEAFIRALRLRTGLGFRLPTEAEWEKSCRAGSTGEHYGPLDKIAWYADNSGMKPHPVGGKAPNAYGLYDMLGNVWEWCSDWNSETYYRQSPYADPTGPATGERKICRGGGFRHRGRYLRAAHRNDMRPDEGRPYHGFRLALDIELP
jgi:formylglycine-generating enzyme required for sulfatase activity